MIYRNNQARDHFLKSSAGAGVKAEDRTANNRFMKSNSIKYPPISSMERLEEQGDKEGMGHNENSMSIMYL